jgi:spore maturation protein SpmB
VKPNLYQLTLGIVVSITVEFLDKYGIQLCKCHACEIIQSKMDTLLQSLSVLYHTIKQRSSTRLDTYQPKFGLAARTTTLEFVALREMS